MNAFLPDETRITQVHLRTRSLKGASMFYGDVLGLQASRRQGGSLAFSAVRGGPPLLVLTERSDGHGALGVPTNLNHFALRYSRREELGRSCARVLRRGWPLDGAFEQEASAAIFVRDPDGNRVELYTDRPRSERHGGTELGATSERELEVEELLQETASGSRSWEPPAKPCLGHLHVEVAELATAERFYREFLGLAVRERSRPDSLFFGAGAWHHQIAVSVAPGEPTPAKDSSELVSYRLEVPLPELLYCLSHRAPLLGYEAQVRDGEPPLLQVRDPNGIWLEIQSSVAGSRAEGPCLCQT